MSARIFLTIIAAAFLAFIGGCTTPDRTAANEQDPMLQKPDEPIHGEVGAFYGHSVGH